MSREVVFGTAAVGLSLLLGAVAAARPLLAVALVGALLFAIFAALHPIRVACVLAFLTAAFPKAGFRVGDFPLPVFLIGLGVATLLIAATHRRRPRSGHVTLVALATTGWVIVRADQYRDDGAAEILAFLAWSIGPLAILALVANLDEVSVRFRRALEWGFLVSAGYALLQYWRGIEEVAVPGVTQTFGDDLAEKNNVIFAVGEDFSKIPSTYHNGNIYGVVAAVFLLLAARRLLERRATRLDLLVTFAAAMAVGLSGSRTAVVAAVVGFVYLAVSRGSLGRKVFLSFAVALTGTLVLIAQPGLVDRYSWTDIANSGGSGRAAVWEVTMAGMDTSDWLFGFEDRLNPEGWLGMVTELGLVGVALICAAIAALTRGRSGRGLVFLTLGVAAVLDSSFLLFPTWFIPAAMFAVAERSGSPVGTGVAERHGVGPVVGAVGRVAVVAAGGDHRGRDEGRDLRSERV